MTGVQTCALPILFDNLRISKLPQPIMKCIGMVPEKLFSDKSRLHKKPKFPKEEGILPSNSFLDIFKNSKFGKIIPRFVGIGPCK